MLLFPLKFHFLRYFFFLLNYMTHFLKNPKISNTVVDVLFDTFLSSSQTIFVNSSLWKQMWVPKSLLLNPSSSLSLKIGCILLKIHERD